MTICADVLIPNLQTGGEYSILTSRLYHGVVRQTSSARLTTTLPACQNKPKYLRTKACRDLTCLPGHSFIPGLKLAPQKRGLCQDHFCTSIYLDTCCLIQCPQHVHLPPSANCASGLAMMGDVASNVRKCRENYLERGRAVCSTFRRRLSGGSLSGFDTAQRDRVLGSRPCSLRARAIFSAATES